MTAVTDTKPLREYLPDVAEALHAQMVELFARPTADGAERLAYNLDGARRLVLQVRAEMLEGG